MAGEEHRPPAAGAKVLCAIPWQFVTLAAGNAYIVDLVGDLRICAHRDRVFDGDLRAVISALSAPLVPYRLLASANAG
ncbi:hypothetical protein GCM10009734_33320 [Nonomuraea bangladeshensis]